jgi:hypothetical protein
MKKNHIHEKPFVPHDISLRDDALHRTKGFHIETFYYDAIFENHYSVVSLVNIFTLGCYGLVLTGMFIYKDAKLVKSKRDKILYQHLAGSEQYPHITIHNKNIIHLISDKDSTPRQYVISMGDTREGFTLRFLQKTSAWKGRTALGEWLVLPCFEVQGNLYCDEKTIPVRGKGYHDHNIYSIFTPLKMIGYHFGKIATDSLVITWANVIKSRGNEEHIVVINKEQKYIHIPPEAIRHTIEKQVKDHGKLIPKKFRLLVKTDNVTLNVSMELLNVHYIHMPILNYWRYHLSNIGEIQIDGFSQKIDTTEISELLRFF